MPHVVRSSRHCHFQRSLVLAVAMLWCAGSAAAVVSGDRFVHFHGAPSLAAQGAAAAAPEGLNPDIDKLLDQPADLWERIRLGFGMPDLDSKIVAQQEAWYAARPDLVRAIIQRTWQPWPCAALWRDMRWLPPVSHPRYKI